MGGGGSIHSGCCHSSRWMLTLFISCHWRKERGGADRKKKRELASEDERKPGHLPSDLDRPRFFRRAGSPAPTRSPRRRTLPALLRKRGPSIGGRKASRGRRRLAAKRQGRQVIGVKEFGGNLNSHVRMMVKMAYLTTVCILHDKAQAVMCLERIL